MLTTLCPSCRSSNVYRLGQLAPGLSFAGRELAEPLPGGELFACRSCALWFRWPQPTAVELESLYQDAAEGHWAAAASNRRDWVEARAWISEHVKGGKILDVGCFDGRFLEFMNADWEPYGIEINENAAQEARRRSVRIVADDVATLSNVEEEFDVITAFDVIEHVSDPFRMLKTLVESLRPGGAILVATGNTQAPSWRLMKHQYWYCTIPEHLSFVGEEWARRAAARLDLEIRLMKRYSHDSDRSFIRVARQGALSLLLKFAPGVFSTLRGWGFGEIKAAGRDDLKTYPPVWWAAKDHILLIFTRRPFAHDRFRESG